MTIETTIWGGIGGFFVAIITALGLMHKVNKLEESTVHKDVCNASMKVVEKMDKDITYLRDRMDEVIDMIKKNGSKY